ncbi:hypothetical protein BMR07_16385 [Methylococcaceae bacterium CS1]|nr:hypothetical protein BMR11_11100 [Methylococcaceae bacterium CS5]TXL02989.1 hypothetical protein BMR07_16385 [Methylococcaceae bacterium CS1]
MRKIIIFFTLVAMTIFTPLAFAMEGELSTIFEEVSSPLDRPKLILETMKSREEANVAIQNIKEPLTHDEKYMLDRWSSGRDTYNKNLRADKLDDNAVTLEKILEKFPPYQKKVYRTTETNAFRDGLIEEGDIVMDKGFLPTSSSPEFIKTFRASINDTFFVIEPKLSAYPLVSNPLQNEVLFTPQTTFKVKEVQTFNGKSYVHLEETDILGSRGIKNIHTGEQYLDTRCSSF